MSFRFWRLAVGRFVFISQSARARLEKLGPLGQKDVVIWNGVSVKDLPSPRIRGELFLRRFGWPEDSLIVGLTGQMAEAKGHEDFIAAAGQVARINPRARFVIGGKPTGPFFSTLRALITAKGLNGVAEFSGWLEASTQFFESIDLFVLASRHDEGFGLVLAEAGERGVAAVATRSGGAPEIIVDNETGILVQKAKPEEMAAAIQKLLSDEPLREATGRRARLRVSRLFNLARQCDEFTKILASI